ncbi:trypsin-like serine protease [Chromatium okenii]|uniref:trypsin-like serine protease n=1 Tax=Chromatium okenii TaxID=61644 RepID=UPI001F5B72EF|nr:trypsin-like serine protease [Chromatium okenii]
MRYQSAINLQMWAVLALLWTAPSWALLGGQADTPDGFGAVIAMMRDDQALHCSATKISQNVFLTAAHCVASTRTGTIDAAFVADQTLFISAAPAPKTRNDFIKLTIETRSIAFRLLDRAATLFCVQNPAHRRVSATLQRRGFGAAHSRVGSG